LEESLRPEPVLFLKETVNNIESPSDSSEFHSTSIDFLSNLSSGETFILPNIFFEFAQSNLLLDSYSELQRLLDYLVKNITVKIEISGHTDNYGADAYNQKLSGERAKTVYNFLINNGIEADRLSYKGYGKEKPIAPNDTEDNRAKNRRTEILILEK
jgi:outer membrane protein OmpA-like peptidoglycan-associated protein